MFKFLCLIIIFVFCSGCATVTTFRVDIDSINSGSWENKRNVFLDSAMENVKNNDLQFKEYISYIKRALISRGFTVVDTLQQADMLIFVQYGVSAPEEHSYTYSIPIWGQTGYSSAKTSGNTYSTGYGQVSYQGTTTYQPSYGVIGSTTEQSSFVTYGNYLRLTGFDATMMKQNPNKAISKSWETKIVSISENGDLRDTFPMMVAAAQPYIGENTGHRITVELQENDKRILEIMSGAKEINIKGMKSTETNLTDEEKTLLAENMEIRGLAELYNKEINALTDNTKKGGFKFIDAEEKKEFDTHVRELIVANAYKIKSEEDFIQMIKDTSKAVYGNTIKQRRGSSDRISPATWAKIARKQYEIESDRVSQIFKNEIETLKDKYQLTDENEVKEFKKAIAGAIIISDNKPYSDEDFIKLIRDTAKVVYDKMIEQRKEPSNRISPETWAEVERLSK